MRINIPKVFKYFSKKQVSVIVHFTDNSFTERRANNFEGFKNGVVLANIDILFDDV